MKHVVWFLAILAVAQAAPSPITKDLLGDYNEFVNLVPSESIRQLAASYWEAGDETFIAQIEYLDGPIWLGIKNRIDSYSIVQQVKTTLRNAGIEIPLILENINAILKGNEAPNTIGMISKRSTKTISSFIEEVDAMWPGTEIEILANVKQVTSPQFKVLWDQMANENTHMVFMAILEIEDVVALRADLDAQGVNTEYFVARLAAFFGWMHHPHESLNV